MIKKCIICGSDDLDTGYFASDHPSYFSDESTSKFLNFAKRSKGILCTSCGFLHIFLLEGDYKEFSRKARTESKKSI